VAGKTRNTANAIYYDAPNDNDFIAQAIMASSQNIATMITKRAEKKSTMKEVWTQLSPEQQQQLYDSWSDKERQFYGVKVRAKTKVEEAKDSVAVEAARQAPLQTEGMKLQNENLNLAVQEGRLKLEEATRLQGIINDPDANPWEAAFAQGLRGGDAEKYVLNKKFPDQADDILMIANKRGPAYAKELTTTYFNDLVKETGVVDPKYTLATATALANATAMGDMSGIEALNKDKKWPEAMKTLAFRRYQLDKDQLHESARQRVSAANNIRTNTTMSVMNLFDGKIQPRDAQEVTDAIINGREVAPWARGRLQELQGMKKAVEQAEMVKVQTEVAERVSGIPEIRSAMDSLRQLENQGVGDNEEQIETLKKQLLDRMKKVYQLEDKEVEEGSFWGGVLSGVVRGTGAAASTVGALTGDAMKGSGKDPLLQSLVQDAVPSTVQGKPTPAGHGSQSMAQTFGNLVPDIPFSPTNAGQGGRPLAASVGQDRSTLITGHVQRLVAEFATAPPARQAAIRSLLANVANDAEGRKILAATPGEP
jgi:hypothetical protein